MKKFKSLSALTGKSGFFLMIAFCAIIIILIIVAFSISGYSGNSDRDDASIIDEAFKELSEIVSQGRSAIRDIRKTTLGEEIFIPHEGKNDYDIHETQRHNVDIVNSYKRDVANLNVNAMSIAYRNRYEDLRIALDEMLGFWKLIESGLINIENIRSARISYDRCSSLYLQAFGLYEEAAAKHDYRIEINRNDMTLPIEIANEAVALLDKAMAEISNIRELVPNLDLSQSEIAIQKLRSNCGVFIFGCNALMSGDIETHDSTMLNLRKFASGLIPDITKLTDMTYALSEEPDKAAIALEEYLSNIESLIERNI